MGNCIQLSSILETLGDVDDDLFKSYLVAPFKYEKSQREAFEDVVEVLKNYEVGHGKSSEYLLLISTSRAFVLIFTFLDNIDGGGFKIIEQDPRFGYLYVQFESLKKGYIGLKVFIFFSLMIADDW